MVSISRRSRKSRSTRAGLLFPIPRIERSLKSGPYGATRVTKGASTYLTAVIEYLVAELLELSGNAARDCRRTRIMPRHILLAYANDIELHQLLKHCVLPQCGVLPCIHTAILPKFAGKIHGYSTKQKLKPVGPPTTNIIKKTAKKPALSKKKGSFSVFGEPKSKASAIKDTGITTLSERVLIRGQKLSVVQGSIVNIKADAFVLPTNDSFYMGGEVGKILTKAGGQQLRDVVAQTATTSTLTNAGDVSICAAPNLSASHLILVHSPKWNATTQDQCIQELDQATTNILTLADQQGLTSVALPSISSGRAGFPKQTAAQTILAALSKYFRQATTTTKLQQVFFVLYDPESVTVYTTELQRMVE